MIKLTSIMLPRTSRQEERCRTLIASMTELLGRLDKVKYRTLGSERSAMLRAGFSKKQVDHLVYLTERIPAAPGSMAGLDVPMAGYTSGAFEIDLYDSPDIRVALCANQGGCCAFCESLVQPTQEGLVTHCRPMAGRYDSYSHALYFPGFFRQAYESSNLLYACRLCCAYKGNDFPELDPNDDQPILIDPYTEDPRGFIRFNPLNGWAFPFDQVQAFYRDWKGIGQVEPILYKSPTNIPGQQDLEGLLLTEPEVESAWQSWVNQSLTPALLRGSETIRILGLNRAGLVRARIAQLRHLRGMFLVASSPAGSTAKPEGTIPPDGGAPGPGSPGGPVQVSGPITEAAPATAPGPPPGGAIPPGGDALEPGSLGGMVQPSNPTVPDSGQTTPTATAPTAPPGGAIPPEDAPKPGSPGGALQSSDPKSGQDTAVETSAVDVHGNLKIPSPWVNIGEETQPEVTSTGAELSNPANSLPQGGQTAGSQTQPVTTPNGPGLSQANQAGEPGSGVPVPGKTAGTGQPEPVLSPSQATAPRGTIGGPKTAGTTGFGLLKANPAGGPDLGGPPVTEPPALSIPTEPESAGTLLKELNAEGLGGSESCVAYRSATRDALRTWNSRPGDKFPWIRTYSDFLKDLAPVNHELETPTTRPDDLMYLVLESELGTAGRRRVAWLNAACKLYGSPASQQAIFLPIDWERDWNNRVQLTKGGNVLKEANMWQFAVDSAEPPWRPFSEYEVWAFGDYLSFQEL